MLGIKIASVEPVDDPGSPVQQVIDRQIGGVATVGVGESKVRGGLDLREQHIQRDALPRSAKLGPLGDTVDVDGRCLARQSHELLPAPAVSAPVLIRDHELPLVARHPWSWPRGEDREPFFQVLTWRKVGTCRPPAAVEARRDDAHSNQTYHSRAHESARRIPADHQHGGPPAGNPGERCLLT